MPHREGRTDTRKISSPDAMLAPGCVLMFSPCAALASVASICMARSRGRRHLTSQFLAQTGLANVLTIGAGRRCHLPGETR